MSAEGDPLEELGAALRARAPRPDEAARAAHLARAQEEFGRLQGGGARGRVFGWMRGPGWAGGGGALVAGAVAACGVLVVLTPVGRGLLDRPPGAGGALEQADRGDGPAGADPTATAAARGVGAAPGAAADGAAPLKAPAPEPVAPQGGVQADGLQDKERGAPLARTQEAEAEALAAPAPPVGAIAPAAPFTAQGVPEAGGVEELLTAYPPRWPAGEGGGPRVTVAVGPAPWDARARLVVVGLGGMGSAGLEVAWDLRGVVSWRRIGGGPGRGVLDRVEAGGLGGTTGLYEVVARGEGPLGVARAIGGEGTAEAAIPGAAEGGTEARWAAAVGGWGLLLSGEDLGGWGREQLLSLADGAAASDPRRAEAIALMRAR